MAKVRDVETGMGNRKGCGNYRVEIGAVGIKNLEYLANRNSSVTVRTLIH